MKDYIRKLSPRARRALVIMIIAKVCVKIIVVLFALSILAPHMTGSTKAAEVQRAKGSERAEGSERAKGIEFSKGTGQPPEGVVPRGHFWDGKGEMRLASITIDGLKRDYYIYRPAGKHVYPLPTVFAFHGHGGTARGMDRFTGGITAIADKEGFLLVFPDGIDKGWVDGRQANAKPVRDDVKFISTLIDHLVSSSLSDVRRVYVCGMSNGGFFAQYLAMKIPDKLAGAAAVGASLSPEQEPFKSGKAIPMMYMLGTKDPLIPWDGGKIGLKRMQNRGQCVPATRAISFWLDNNGVSSQNQTSERIPDISKIDRCTASKAVYGNGNPRSDMIVYQIDNGGHTWPGGQQYLPAFIIGNTNRDFNANEVLWSFFKEHHN